MCLIHCQVQKVNYMGIVRPTPKEKSIKGATGAESEAVIAAALIQEGYTVLTPNGYMHRYDLVIEDAEGKFWKVQCKTAWHSKDGATLRFNGFSLLMKGQKGRSESKRMGYENDVDYFAVYSPNTRKVYLLPITCEEYRELLAPYTYGEQPGKECEMGCRL